MRRDPTPPDGEDNPLDAALGELEDLAEIEQGFARLDARLDAVHRREDTFDPMIDEDDPFADVAQALREHYLGSPGIDDPARTDLTLDNDGDERSEDVLDDPDAAAIELRCQDALDLLDAGELEQARELALEALRIDDEHPFPTFVLGLIAEQEGDLDAARDLAELSLRTAGTNADAIGLRAHIHVRQHELPDAEALLRFGIVHNPDDPTLHEGLARVALAQGEHDEALRAANAALRLEPANPGALAVRTAALDASGDRGALLAALRQGVQLHPEDPYGMVELAAMEMEHGNLDRARVLLMRAQRLAPRDPEISDVRRLVEHVHERPLLRPVPPLLRWLRDFPGGLAGFLIGFVIAALPLHALATTIPQYRLPATLLILGWGVAALYAWVAPAMLTYRLNQRAAHAASQRLQHELADPLAPGPSLDRIIDVIMLLVVARHYRAAAHVMRTASQRGAVPAAARSSVDRAVRRLDGPRARLVQLPLAVPAAGRLLVAAATAIMIFTPTLVAHSAVSYAGWQGIALACAVTAWGLTRLQRHVTRSVERTWTVTRAAAAAEHAAASSA